MLGAVVGFATMGLQRALCPGGEEDAVFDRLGSQDCESFARIAARGIIIKQDGRFLQEDRAGTTFCSALCCDCD